MQFYFALLRVAPVVYSDRKVDRRIRSPPGAEGGNTMGAGVAVHTIRGCPRHFSLSFVIYVDHDAEDHH